MERSHYGRDRSQYGELSLPAGRRPAPVAVLLHGGFWGARYGLRLMHRLVDDLLPRGWATWNLEYRRLGPGAGGGYPMTLADVGAGIDHLELLAPDVVGEPRLDLRRVVAVGHSAGGHLAAWAATRAAPGVRVSACVCQAGVVDLGLAYRLDLFDGIVARFIGGTPEAVPERYAIASPAERLPLGLPLLLTHGARDEVVPPELSERFAAAATAAGDDVTLRIEPGEAHMGHLDPQNPLWRAVVAWLEPA